MAREQAGEGAPVATLGSAHEGTVVVPVGHGHLGGSAITSPRDGLDS
jgi:hypothetical protein